jgi:hypothetical protein
LFDKRIAAYLLLYFWYERRYENVAHVKTAISLDESLFREAENWAGKLGVSRSQLFALAVEEYVRRHENEELLRRLNEAHADGPEEEDEVALRHGQALHVEMLRRAEREGRQ